MTSPAAGDVAVPVLIAWHTAQRLGDVLALRWCDYDGAAITLRQGKTGALVSVAVHPELRGVLDGLRPADGAICRTARGAPWKPDHFKHVFARVRAKLGLPADLHFHGLRHSAATRLAEAGASDAEIAAVTGHRTRSMVARYTRQAAQKRLAAAAIKRVSVPSRPPRVSNRGTRSVKLRVRDPVSG